MIDLLVFAMGELPDDVNHRKEGKMSEYRQPPKENLCRARGRVTPQLLSVLWLSVHYNHAGVVCLGWCDSASSKEREQTDLCYISEVKDGSFCFTPKTQLRFIIKVKNHTQYRGLKPALI